MVPLGADFARFRADQGPLLYEHACFEALHAARMPKQEWRTWPADLRDPRGAAVAFFAQSQPDEILFHQFLQWISDRSVDATQLAARHAGMRIGLIGDLAVGMDPGWQPCLEPPGRHPARTDHRRAAGSAEPQGPGLGPDRLFAARDGGRTGSRRSSRRCGRRMRHVGGIRVDHAMGLARLWLVPEGASPADGAYLNYPVVDLLRLLALESVRHNVVVIGEDLGTVPEGFHDMLEQGGIHGMRVLWFERDTQAGFMPPRGWGSSAVAMTSTHDLPTVAGWWKGSDIDVRHQHGRLGEGVDPDDGSAERETGPALTLERLCARARRRGAGSGAGRNRSRGGCRGEIRRQDGSAVVADPA